MQEQEMRSVTRFHGLSPPSALSLMTNMPDAAPMASSQLVVRILNLALLAHRLPALLDHGGQDLVDHLRRRQGCLLARALVCRGDLHDVGSDQVQRLDAAEDPDQLPRGPAAGLRRARSGGEGCVKGPSQLKTRHKEKEEEE